MRLHRAGYTLKPRCRRCARLFLNAYKRLCQPCTQRPSRARQRRPRPVRCDCGRPAHAIVEIRVGLPDPDDPGQALWLEYLPLCPACAKVEIAQVGPGLTCDYRPR